MDKRGRYSQYHDAPQRVKTTLAQRIKTWAWASILSSPQEGRKRIIPGYENTNLGAGWYRVEPKEGTTWKNRK